jgi:hypothetical protein
MVDALDSGSSDLTVVEVRVFSWAPSLFRWFLLILYFFQSALLLLEFFSYHDCSYLSK